MPITPLEPGFVPIERRGWVTLFEGDGHRESLMICRIWHGRTALDKADRYAAFLERRAIPDYRAASGNVDVAVLRRDDGDVAHFLTVTHWTDEAAVREFAGDAVLTAKYYPEDREFLLEFEPTVEHYVVVAREGRGSRASARDASTGENDE